MRRALVITITLVSLPMLACGGGGGDTTGGPDAAASTPDAGTAADGAPSPAEIVLGGAASVATAPRPAYGALLVANDGERSYVVESRRDVEPGPFGLPWRSRFRVAAYDRGALAWDFDADPDDAIGDVVVHPSGDVTLSLERHPVDRLAYVLVRLSRAGDVIATTTLPPPVTIPDGDYAPAPRRPLFRMKSDLADATSAGWVRLLADGEGLVAAFLSYGDAPPTEPLSAQLVLGIAAFDLQAGGYVERWARVVDGPHKAQPVAWAYDELRWREQAVRPFLARDDTRGDLLVGRAWNTSRCGANVATFAEVTADDCRLHAVSPVEVERLPLAVSRFSSRGERLGTRVLVPDEDAAEQVAFALAARDGELAVAGAVVRMLPDGSKRTYPDPSGYVDYDGYVSIHDADGRRLRGKDLNLGRGDLLVALRWTAQGIVAVGAAGWDRWQGGMSISRGADPLFVWLAADAKAAATRVVPLSDQTRHFNLHDVVLLGDAIVGYGFADAPMTHSGDGGQTSERTFGPLQIRLDPPAGTGP